MAGSNLTLADLGEDRFVGGLVSLLSENASVVVGPGDDCAVVTQPGGDNLLLLKADCVVEGIHYLPSERPLRVGRKAIGRALSDIAAMGGEPTHALVTLFSPPETPAAYWKKVYRGAVAMASLYNVSIVGGETSSAGFRAVNVSLLGKVKPSRVLTRSGGSPGDLLFVTGRLGGSRKRKHWAFFPRLEEGRWLAATGAVSAMMDLSDGLAADLPRLASASGCGFEVEFEKLPVTRGETREAACCDGEDYELLFAVPPRRAKSLTMQFAARFPSVPMSCIGSLQKGPIGSGNLPGCGFRHFSVASERRT